MLRSLHQLPNALKIVLKIVLLNASVKPRIVQTDTQLGKVSRL